MSPYLTSEAIHSLVSQFKSRALPKTLWTHEAHILVALCYLREAQSVAAAHARLREDIPAYNVSVGTANTDTSGYHDTLTVFWLEALAPFVARDEGQDVGSLYAGLKDTPFVQGTLPLAFYSRARLFSTTARRNWVEPDLLPMAMLSLLIEGKADAHNAWSDDAFESLFSSGTMSPNLFTHEAHLRLAWIHLRKYEHDQAIDNVTRQLRDFVTRVGAVDKYNHTLTVAAIRVVDHFMKKSDAPTFYALLLAYPRLKHNFKDLLGQHYSKDALFTEKARKEYVEPDLLAF